MEDPVSNDQRLFGYPMHQTCWLFLEKILGKTEEADLPHLMTAFKLLWDGGHVDVEKNAALPTNPMKIPSLHSLIHRFMKPPRKSQKSVDAEPSVIQHIPTAFDNFPLELLYCVLDYLSAKEVRQFLLSFGLTIPEAYWMGRFQDDLMYEVAAYEPSGLDWKILCLRTEAILERGSCHSLTYRARIFGILKILRMEFLRIRSRNGTSNSVLSDWIVTFRSAWNANVFTQSLYIPPVVDEVYFSFVGGTGGYLLSGMKIYPGGELGFCRPDSSVPGWAIVRPRAAISQMLVKLDSVGVRDLTLRMREDRGVGLQDLTKGIIQLAFYLIVTIHLTIISSVED